MPGPDLPQHLRAGTADQLAGGRVPSGHLGFPFASPALFNKIGQRFRKAVADYAKTNSIPWIVFGKGDDNSPSWANTCAGRPSPAAPA